MVKAHHAARLALVVFSAGCSLVTGFDDLDPSLESCLPGATRTCYEGPEGTNDVGTCTGGVATCSEDGGYGPCVGQVLPASDDCATAADESCGTENTCGGGGGGATTTATSSTSTGCQPDCGPDKRCGDDGCGGLCNGVEMPPTFWLDELGGDVTNLEPWPETQSLFVTTTADEIVRVDLCDGSILAQTSMNGVEGLAVPSIDVVGRVDEVLFAVGVQPDAAAALAGFDVEALGLLDSAPLPAGFNGGLADTTPVADRFVAVHAANNGTASSIGMQGSCSLTIAATGWKGRGVAFDGNETFYLMANSTPTMRFYAACADLCACSAAEVRTGDNLLQNFHLFDIGWTGSRLVVAGYRNITGDPAVLATVDGPALAAAAELRIFQGTGIDVFTSVTGHGGFVFAGGAAGTANTSNIAGIGWLVRVPEAFTNATSEADIVTTSIALTQRISRVAADDGGVYAGGLSESGGGFVTKCTHDLSACGMP